MSTDTKSPLRILGFEVENILRVVAVSLRPDGRVLEITGANGAGKTSLLTALWIALGGEKACPDDPIHKGADAGHVIVDIGDDSGTRLKVTRKISRKKSGDGISTTLTVENADGARFQKPQDILNSLIGSLSCDPLEFMRMKSKDQYETLKAFVPGYDFAATEQANAKDFTARTDVNRSAKALRARADAIVVPADAPTDRVDESALIEELDRVGFQNAEAERLRSQREQEARNIAHAADTARQDRARAADLRRQADAMDEQAEHQESHVAELQAKFDAAEPIPEPINTAEVRTKIEAARRANTAFDNAARLRADKAKLTAEADDAETKSEALTDAIDKRKSAMVEAIAAAKMPVEGISFGDGEILFDGFPLGQASGAQQLRLSVAIAAAQRPRLRFVTIKDASLLDDQSWDALCALAEEMDLLVIAETVSSDRPGAVVIEDGSIKQILPAMQAAE